MKASYHRVSAISGSRLTNWGLSIMATALLLGTGGGSRALAWELLPVEAPSPHDNPRTSEKVELGKLLYFDPRLSKTEKVSCNSCHGVHTNHSTPRPTGTDVGPTSVGINGLKGGRRAPSVWNAAFWEVQFWDGRAKTLEDQAKGPLTNPIEMGMENHEAVVKRLNKIKGYRPYFTKAFGDGPLSIDQVAQAIASFERTLITPDSPYDLYLKGNKAALSASAERGMNLAKSVGCVACHSGPHFNGPKTGAGFYMKFPTIPGSTFEKQYKLAEDQGRYNVTHQDSDKHMWRVPSWRNVELRAPYFHNGSVATLEEAVRVMAKTQLARDLKDAEVSDLAAFLRSLTGKLPKIEEPTLPAE